MLQASKVDQTQKFDFLDLAPFFQIWPDSVFIEMNVRNDVMNNFEFINELFKIHSFHSKSLRNWQHSAISQKKNSFLVNFRDS